VRALRKALGAIADRAARLEKSLDRMTRP